MEDSRKLYPLKFRPIRDEYAWGAAEFTLADLGYRDTLVQNGWLAANSLSEVMEMYMDGIVGEEIFACYGRQFPFQVKKLEVRGKMPLQVCPDDEIALQRYDCLGKEKIWVVVRAGDAARVAMGFGRDTDAAGLLASCEDSGVAGLLNIVPVHAGDHFHIAPGIVHAAFGDIDIIEISESSALDFCLCAWGQTLAEDEFDPSLGPVEALDFIRYAAGAPDVEALSLPQFSVSTAGTPDKTQVSGASADGTCRAYCSRDGKVVLVPEDAPTAPNSTDDWKSDVLLEIVPGAAEKKDGYIG